MHFPSLSVALGIASSLIQAAAVPNSHVVHEKRDATSTKWVKRGKLSPDAILAMRIGLSQRNLDVRHDLLMDVGVKCPI
jgi:tripeptidyl-peptidase-1